MESIWQMSLDNQMCRYRGGKIDAGPRWSSESHDYVWPLHLAHADIRSRLVPEQNLPLSLSYGFDFYRANRLWIGSESSSYHYFVDADGYGEYFDGTTQATTEEEEGQMSHEYHGSDVYGSYNENCPDCNSPWLRAAKALLAYHYPVLFGADSASLSEICDKCNTAGGGDVLWPCDTASILKREIRPDLFEQLVEEARNERRARDGEGTRQVHNPPQADGSVLRGDSGVRFLRESEAWDRANLGPAWGAALAVSGMSSGREAPGPTDCRPMGSGEEGPYSIPEAAVPRPSEMGVPELERCTARRRPSSVEKCGYYLFYYAGLNYSGWVCPLHGARNF